MRVVPVISAAALAATLAGAGEAAAQATPTAEGAIGYAYLHDEELSLGFPVGWVASVAGNATSWLSLVGEVGGSYRNDTIGDADLKLRVHAFTAGPRLAVTSNAPISPFVQLLVGVAHGAVDVGVPGVGLVVRGTSLAVQPGIGINLNPSLRRALRLQFDRRGLRNEGRTRGQWRVVVAAVFRS